MNKILAIISLLFHLLNGSVFSQSLSETTRIADSLMMESDTENALKLYKRALFFSDTDPILLKKTANTYFIQKDFQEALLYYDSAIIVSASQDRNELIFSKTDCYIFLGQYDSAFRSINQLNPENNDFFIRRVNVYNGIICFSEERYEEAEIFFLNALSDSAIQSKEKIKALFEKKGKFRSPKPIVAGFMSLVMPGTGQFYSGHINSGTNSIVLLGILSIIAVDMGIRYSFYDPLITILPWFIRYYKGGYLNSKELANEKLNQNRTKTLNEILEIIQAANE